MGMLAAIGMEERQWEGRLHTEQERTRERLEPRGSRVAAINNSRWQLLMSVGVRPSSDNYFAGSGPTKSILEGTQNKWASRGGWLRL
jgi:hypothetical protein